MFSSGDTRLRVPTVPSCTGARPWPDSAWVLPSTAQGQPWSAPPHGASLANWGGVPPSLTRAVASTGVMLAPVEDLLSLVAGSPGVPCPAHGVPSGPTSFGKHEAGSSSAGWPVWSPSLWYVVVKVELVASWRAAGGGGGSAYHAVQQPRADLGLGPALAPLAPRLRLAWGSARVSPPNPRREGRPRAPLHLSGASVRSAAARAPLT